MLVWPRLKTVFLSTSACVMNVCRWCICSSTEAGDTTVARANHSRSWLDRPLVSGDGSQLERHLVSEQYERQELEETLGLLHHHQQPASLTVSVVDNAVHAF